MGKKAWVSNTHIPNYSQLLNWDIQTFTCSTYDPPDEDLPSRFTSLYEYCVDSEHGGANITCIGLNISMNGSEVAPDTEEYEDLSGEALWNQNCWTYCSCEVPMVVNRPGPSPTTSTTVGSPISSAYTATQTVYPIGGNSSVACVTQSACSATSTTNSTRVTGADEHVHLKGMGWAAQK